MAQRITAKGHKLTKYWLGVGDNFANGRCECGWAYGGTTERMAVVYRSHQSHLKALGFKEPPEPAKPRVYKTKQQRLGEWYAKNMPFKG